MKAHNSEGEAVLEAPTRARSEWARAKDTEGVVCQTHVGGQALIEGIMMRGKYNWAVAVREPSGSIYVEEHDLASGKNQDGVLHKPVVRGCTALVESLALGYKALEIASQHAFDFDDEDEEGEEVPTGRLEGAPGGALEAATDGAAATAIAAATAVGDATATATAIAVDGATATATVATVGDATAPGDALEAATTPGDAPALSSDGSPDGDGEAVSREDGKAASTSPENELASGSQDRKDASGSRDDNAIPKPLMTVTMIIGILLGIGIFIVLPALITNLLVGDYGEKTLLWNIIDGILRIVVFVFYIWLIGRMKDIKRMFGYHGAEHKTIHCYEHGLELTVENAQRFPTLHVRCGTAFLLTTMLIAILVFTIVPVGPLIDVMGVTNGAVRLILVICSRIILMPIIAGLSYEVTVKWAGSHPESPFVQFVLWPGLQMQRLTTNQPDDEMVECAIASMKRVLEREDREHAAKQVKVEG
jgi:uncharacterized protein YqhQ